MLRFELQINQAAQNGDNDRCLELVRDQRDWYEHFGYGSPEERAKYWATKDKGKR